MWEMWFIATTQPPEAGIFSPSIHSCFVVVTSSGLMIATTVVQAQPRFSWTLRTLSMYSPSSPPDRAGRAYRRGWEDRRRDDSGVHPSHPDQGRPGGEDPP